MELVEALRTRRMVRSYDPNRPVEREVLQKLLNLAIRAPSAGHTQGWRFLVLDDITSRSLFWSVASTGPSDAWRSRMQEAPVLVLCFSDRQAYLDRYAEADKVARSPDSSTDRDPQDWAIPYWHVDTGMAALLLLLSAHDRGLAAAFFGVPRSRWPALFDAFEVPDGLEPVGVVSLGHPGVEPEQPRPRRRRQPLDEVVRYGSFG